MSWPKDPVKYAEARRKQSESQSGRVVPPELRKRISESSKGEKNHFYGKHHSEESKSKMSNAMKGKKRGPFSEEHSRRKSDAQRGDKNNAKRPEVRAKISATLTGTRLPDEVKQKISETLKGKPPFSPERKRNIAEANRRSAHKRCFSGERNPNWRGGIAHFPYCSKFNNEFKETIRDHFGRECYLCGCAEEDNHRKLSVHHVDYAKNAICNGKAWAFVPLCSKCHTRTNTNRWYWFGRLIYYWAIDPGINFNCGDMWCP